MRLLIDPAKLSAPMPAITATPAARVLPPAPPPQPAMPSLFS
jgi:hypothetical protein